MSVRPLEFLKFPYALLKDRLCTMAEHSPGWQEYPGEEWCVGIVPEYSIRRDTNAGKSK